MRSHPRAAVLAAALVLVALAAFGWSKLHDGRALASKASAPTLAASPPILRKARADGPGFFRQAMDAGATISLTPDRRSFSVLWSPPDPKATIVTLHGYKSTALGDFSRWRRYAEQRGYAVLAIQWRLGSARSAEYTPAQIYRIAADILARRGVQEGGAILYGFSSAAVRTYPITALDRRGKRLFGLSIANAGGILPGLAANRLLVDGAFGRRPLAGSRWAFYCGGRDPNVDYAGCAEMRRTAGTVRRLGGTVVLLIADPSGRHGDFISKPAAVGAALDAYAGRR